MLKSYCSKSKYSRFDYQWWNSGKWICIYSGQRTWQGIFRFSYISLHSSIWPRKPQMATTQLIIIVGAGPGWWLFTIRYFRNRIWPTVSVLHGGLYLVMREGMGMAISQGVCYSPVPLVQSSTDSLQPLAFLLLPKCSQLGMQSSSASRGRKTLLYPSVLPFCFC